MPELELSDRSCLYYQDPQPNGNPAVLLLHGLGATSASWQLQLPALLGRGYRPLIPDLPGFGKSIYQGKGWSIASMVSGCVELLDHLNISRAHIVGISMGGVVALQLAITYPGLVERLVLANTFASLRPDTPSGWMYLLKRYVVVNLRGLPAQAEFVAWRIFPQPEQETLRRLLVEEVRQADPRVYRRAMRALGWFNVQDRLGEITRPTLVISGECDTTVPLRNQSILAERIQNARQVVIRGAGHAVSIDQSEAFNQELVAFLSEGNR